MKKELLLLITFVLSLFPSSLWAQEDPSQQRLVVWLKSGEKVTYQLDKMPRTTFVGTQLNIATNSGASVSYPLSAVLRYTYEGIIDGVEGAPVCQNVRISTNGDAVTFENLPDGSEVQLYNAAGILLHSAKVTPAGSVGSGASSAPVTISIADRPTGVYIVKAARQTIKLLKK